jgi:hypothetical protein
MCNSSDIAEVPAYEQTRATLRGAGQPGRAGSSTQTTGAARQAFAVSWCSSI